jgi:hypothetical protein
MPVLATGIHLFCGFNRDVDSGAKRRHDTEKAPPAVRGIYRFTKIILPACVHLSTFSARAESSTGEQPMPVVNNMLVELEGQREVQCSRTSDGMRSYA